MLQAACRFLSPTRFFPSPCALFARGRLIQPCPACPPWEGASQGICHFLSLLVTRLPAAASAEEGHCFSPYFLYASSPISFLFNPLSQSVQKKPREGVPPRNFAITLSLGTPK